MSGSVVVSLCQAMAQICSYLLSFLFHRLQLNLFFLLLNTFFLGFGSRLQSRSFHFFLLFRFLLRGVSLFELHFYLFLRLWGWFYLFRSTFAPCFGRCRFCSIRFCRLRFPGLRLMSRILCRC